MEIVFRATALFFFVWAITRIPGKRSLSQLNAFELILLVTVGDLIQQGVTQEDMSVTGAMLAVGTIGLWITVFSYVSWRWPAARQLIDGIAVVVVRDGRPVPEAMNLERLPLDELLEAARREGIGDLAEVRFAVLEPDGHISFIKSSS